MQLQQLTCPMIAQQTTHSTDAPAALGQHQLAVAVRNAVIRLQTVTSECSLAVAAWTHNMALQVAVTTLRNA